MGPINTENDNSINVIWFALSYKMSTTTAQMQCRIGYIQGVYGPDSMREYKTTFTNQQHNFQASAQ